VNQVGGSDQNDGAYRSHRKKGNSPMDGNAKSTEDPTSNYRSDQAESDISKEPITFASHQLSGKPAGD
jgi:hypothetical protein